MTWELMSCCWSTVISNMPNSIFHNWTRELCHESICSWAGETTLYFFHVTSDSIDFTRINSFPLRKGREKSCQSERSTTEADQISIYAFFTSGSASFQPLLHMHELLLKTSISITLTHLIFRITTSQAKQSIILWRASADLLAMLSTQSEQAVFPLHNYQMGSSIQDSPLECTR